MKEIKRDSYTLLLSEDPCELFEYFNVKDMHGLNQAACKRHLNNEKQSYIAGLSNYVPKPTNKYSYWDERFIFINVTRCIDDIHTMGLVMHEAMHHSIWLHGEDLAMEEDIISWAEEEAYKIVEIIKSIK